MEYLYLDIYQKEMVLNSIGDPVKTLGLIFISNLGFLTQILVVQAFLSSYGVRQGFL